MKRPVLWSLEARQDLEAITRYIADRNPDAAERVATRIAATATSLSDFATGRAGRVAGTFEKSVAALPYILAYTIAAHPEGGDMIAVLHVIHGARDWPSGRWPAAEPG